GRSASRLTQLVGISSSESGKLTVSPIAGRFYARRGRADWTDVRATCGLRPKGAAGGAAELTDAGSSLIAPPTHRGRAAGSARPQRHRPGSNASEPDLSPERRRYEAEAHGSLSGQEGAAVQRRDGHRPPRTRRRGGLPALLRAPRRSARLARHPGPL